MFSIYFRIFKLVYLTQSQHKHNKTFFFFRINPLSRTNLTNQTSKKMAERMPFVSRSGSNG